MVETITYMAPEQIEAHPQPASDQYSLGIVVYEWLVGEPPFQGSIAELPAMHKDMPPPSLREKNSNIAPPVETVVMKALAKDWTQRFTDMQAFATALEQASNFENEPTIFSAPPSQPLDATVAVQFPSQQPPEQAASMGQQASHGISRRVVVSGLLGLVALGAIGGGIVWLSRRNRHHWSLVLLLAPLHLLRLSRNFLQALQCLALIHNIQVLMRMSTCFLLPMLLD